jgi:hypothetical protein
MGKWSDSGEDVGIVSTQIHCYKRFDLCEVAHATYSNDLVVIPTQYVERVELDIRAHRRA